MNRLYTELQKPITAAKVLTLLASTVKSLEEVRNLTGFQKRDMALRALRYVITKADVTEEERAALLDLIDTVGSTAVDLLVEFGRDAKTFIHEGCQRPKCTLL